MEATPAEDSGPGTSLTLRVSVRPHQPEALARPSILSFRNRNRRDSVMPLERIHLAHLIVFIFLLFTGCLSPDRAGQDRVTMMRSRDRSLASRVTAPGNPQPIGGDRVAVQASSMAATSRAQNPDVIRAAPDDSWSPAKSGAIVQASGRDSGRQGQTSTPSLNPAGGSSPASPPPTREVPGNSVPPAASVPNSSPMLTAS